VESGSLTMLSLSERLVVSVRYFEDVAKMEMWLSSD
jgi:hypothetical protein